MQTFDCVIYTNLKSVQFAFVTKRLLGKKEFAMMLGFYIAEGLLQFISQSIYQPKTNQMSV